MSPGRLCEYGAPGSLKRRKSEYPPPSPRAFPTRLPGRVAKIVLKESLARTAREELYLGLFWSEFLPNGRPLTSHAACLSTGGWTTGIDHLYNKDAIFRLVCMALSVTVLGEKNGDTQLVIKGLKTYSNAITHMRLAVASHAGRRKIDGLLAASGMMSLYEILFGGYTAMLPKVKMQFNGWRGHIRGSESLILSRGAESVQTGLAHQLFSDGRFKMLMNDIQNRRRCLLSSKYWKTVPWRKTEKSIYDKLIDIMLDSSDLYYTMSFIQDSTKRSRSKQLQLQNEWVVRSKICHDALVDWEEEIGSPIRKFDFTYYDSCAQLPLPRTDTDRALLELSNTYWVTCLSFYSILCRMREIEWRGTRHNPFENEYLYRTYGDCLTDDLRRDPTANAYKIAYAARLYWAPSAGTFGGLAG